MAARDDAYLRNFCGNGLNQRVLDTVAAMQRQIGFDKPKTSSIE